MKGFNLYQLMKAENDFAPVIKTAVKECGVKDDETANLLLDGFLQLFSLIPKLGENDKLHMIKSVDPIWHAFVLNTSFYREFCDKYIGFFVDHDPMDGNTEKSKRKVADYTLNLVKKEFGAQVSTQLLSPKQGATYYIGLEKDSHTVAFRPKEFSIF